MVNTKEIFKKYNNFFWQYPAITEEAFYTQNNLKENYLGFPWATVHDQHINLNTIYQILKQYIDPEKKYYTCCQHIVFRKFIPLWKALNIVLVYASHKTINEDLIDGIIIKPCPLFAVNIENDLFNTSFKNIDLLNNDREILYNFVGGYQSADYLTQIRPNIFKMKHSENCIVKHTGVWHLHDVVFSKKQNHNLQLNINDNFKNKTEYFNYLLINSRYTLCPSGSGPNSIRFWEALGAGSIPVLLADTLELPSHELWTEAIIRLPENRLKTLPKILEEITLNKEKEMRENCLKIYKYFKDNYKNNIIKK